MAFAVRNGLLPSMSKNPKPISDRFITLRFPLVDGWYWTLIVVDAPTITNSSEKYVISTIYSTRYFLRSQMQTRSSFLETLTPEIANHITPGQTPLVSLERGRLIRIAICCYPSTLNTNWSLPTATSNTSKSKRTAGCTQDPKTGTSSTSSSHDSVICLTFWTQKRWEKPASVLTM